jgi:metal-responsive CopG/Arc/MetJ family transcriptional regulator
MDQRINTIAPGKKRISLDEDEAIVQQIDELAAREGLSRSDMYRRAVRFFLASDSMNRIIPSIETADVPA